MVTNMSDNKSQSAPGTSTADATANDRFAQAQARRTAAISTRDGVKGTATRSRNEDLGGLQLKLSVRGEIEGHHLYWANDDAGEIEQLLYEGFDFVAPEEIGRAAELVADMDVGHRVSRYVGRLPDGSPMRAYLLKCPNELWEARASRGQRQAEEWDNQIRNGRMKPQKGDGQYVPSGVSSHLDVNAKV